MLINSLVVRMNPLPMKRIFSSNCICASCSEGGCFLPACGIFVMRFGCDEEEVGKFEADCKEPLEFDAEIIALLGCGLVKRASGQQPKFAQ